MAGDEGTSAETAADGVVSPEQIVEYESQLAGIEQLLDESPNDESLLALKKDMEELLALSKAGVEAVAAAYENDEDDDDDEAQANETEGIVPPSHDKAEGGSMEATTTAMQAGAMRGAMAIPDEALPQQAVIDDEHHSAAVAAMMGKKKSSTGSTKKEKIKDFVLPPHLIPNEGDTEAERNKKRRAAKALKNKWREKKKEAESTNRQKSWQSFQKKTGKRDAASGSIFSTKEGMDDRVGVVSKKQLTEFDARKRHKHT